MVSGSEVFTSNTSYSENATDKARNVTRCYSGVCRQDMENKAGKEITEVKSWETDNQILSEEILAIHSDLPKSHGNGISRLSCRQQGSSRISVMESSTKSSRSKQTIRALNKNLP